jgi:Fur family ferric uptake transcriptional regulator
MSPRERFSDYLANQGKRLTSEPSIIVDEIFSSYEDFDAEQLVARLSQRTDGSRVNRSTIYRALMELAKARLLRKLDGESGLETYERVD